jgi:glycosyltransferase involved in cell wall biosynthesis
MRKNILFYIPNIDQSWGGVRQYSFNILKMISENLTQEFRFYIYHENGDKLFTDIIDVNDNFMLIQKDSISKTKIKYQTILYKIIYILSLKKINLKVLNSFEQLLKKHKIDIVHCPYQFIPKTKNAKLITTMHDVQELYFPEFFSPEDRAYRAVNYYDFMKRADAIIVSYSHVKEDLIKFFYINESKIHTLLIGIQYLWVNNFNVISNTNKSDKKKLFLLYPANSWKHKNHLGILKALQILKSENKIINLIFTGDFNNEYGVFLINKISEFGLENQIEVKGIVDQNKLYDLYINSTGIVIPTLYEAGSYPLYESIFLEKPVICSNVTSLPESIGNEEFIFSPNDYNDIAEKIEKLYFSEEYREQSIINSIRMKQRLKNNDFIKSLFYLYKTI